MDIFIPLPEETLIHILSFCNVKSDYISIACSCSFFNRLINDNNLWERYFYKRFGYNAKIRPIYKETIEWKNEYKWRTNPSIYAQYFNENPENCIENMMKSSIITDGISLVSFLRDTPGLSHKVAYQFVSQPHKFGVDPNIITNSILNLNLHGKSIIECLQVFSIEFGSIFAQGGQDMALTALSQNYFTSDVPNIEYFKTKDSVYTFLYSILMLNTDLHSKQVVKKMSSKLFIQNLHTMGVDLPNDYISSIYNEINNNEIVLQKDNPKIKITNPIYEGWMKVKESGMKKSWCILLSDCLLICKKKGYDYIEYIPIIYNSKVYEPEALVRLNRDQFVLYSTKAYYFTPPQSEYKQWIDEIQKCISNISEMSLIATNILQE